MAPLYTAQNLPLSPLFILCPHFALLHCYSILLITTLLNYILYSLHRIYYLSNILRFNHLSIYFAVHLFFILSYYCIFTILYRGSMPCTGNVEPSVYGSKWPLFIIVFFISFSSTFGISLSKTSFCVSPLTAFLSILRVTIP